MKEALTEGDVIGTWTLTSQSFALFTRDGFQRDPAHLYTITFRADGTCTFASVQQNFEPHLPRASYFTSEGEWFLEHDTHGDSDTRKKNALRLELHPQPNFKDEFYFNFCRGQNRELILWNYYGDPDESKFIEYSRASSQR